MSRILHGGDVCHIENSIYNGVPFGICDVGSILVFQVRDTAVDRHGAIKAQGKVVTASIVPGCCIQGIVNQFFDLLQRFLVLVLAVDVVGSAPGFFGTGLHCFFEPCFSQRPLVLDVINGVLDLFFDSLLTVVEISPTDLFLSFLGTVHFFADPHISEGGDGQQGEQGGAEANYINEALGTGHVVTAQQVFSIWQ